MCVCVYYEAAKNKIQTKLNGKENIYIVVRINTTNNDMSVLIYRIFGIEELIWKREKKKRNLSFFIPKASPTLSLSIYLVLITAG